MNLGLVTSFIIAALLMLSIVSMNLRMSQSTQDISLHTMSQSHVSAISDLIQYDFPKIGYNVSGPISNPIAFADEDEIQFQANLDNDAGESIEAVTWRLEDDVLAGSNNTDHRSLVRITGGDTQEINVGVTRFEIRYYSFGDPNPLTTPVANTADINRIEVILEVQPREGTGRNNQYTTSSWHRVFTPPNLNL
ncbi:MULTISPECIES: hypothetical protein [Rhodohalobacter]|uniref:Type 4 fimbrial biogenesis protein PilX N-terminal domain-containing protein n=1 Tax=Rhodohalobacter barkolensis TaxID=2053187 RepID=A0A2N0VH25_9BACT|nr:hypothetical protein [Rhodohalobacter barkolensis]PKD43502.1 hypothetical protein CWD77_07995 [Rhodohalobacter barkolensis]